MLIPVLFASALMTSAQTQLTDAEIGRLLDIFVVASLPPTAMARREQTMSKADVMARLKGHGSELARVISARLASSSGFRSGESYYIDLLETIDHGRVHDVLASWAKTANESGLGKITRTAKADGFNDLAKLVALKVERTPEIGLRYLAESFAGLKSSRAVADLTALVQQGSYPRTAMLMASFGSVAFDPIVKGTRKSNQFFSGYLDALASVRDPRVPDEVMKLTPKRPSEFGPIAKAFSTQGASVVPRLVKMWRSPGESRTIAESSLALIDSPAVFKPISDIVNVYAHQKNQYINSDLLHSMMRSNPAGSRAFIRTLAGDTDSNARIAAIRMLDEYHVALVPDRGQYALRDVALKLTKDADPQVRRWAYTSVANTYLRLDPKTRSQGYAAIKAGLRDRDVDAQIAAIGAISAFFGKETEDALLKIQNDTSLSSRVRDAAKFSYNYAKSEGGAKRRASNSG